MGRWHRCPLARNLNIFISPLSSLFSTHSFHPARIHGCMSKMLHKNHPCLPVHSQTVPRLYVTYQQWWISDAACRAWIPFCLQSERTWGLVSDVCRRLRTGVRLNAISFWTAAAGHLGFQAPQSGTKESPPCSSCMKGPAQPDRQACPPAPALHTCRCLCSLTQAGLSSSPSQGLSILGLFSAPGPLICLFQLLLISEYESGQKWLMRECPQLFPPHGPPLPERQSLPPWFSGLCKAGEVGREWEVSPWTSSVDLKVSCWARRLCEAWGQQAEKHRSVGKVAMLHMLPASRSGNKRSGVLQRVSGYLVPSWATSPSV